MRHRREAAARATTAASATGTPPATTRPFGSFAGSGRPAEQNFARDLAFSPDGKRLAAVFERLENSGRAVVRSLPDGKERYRVDVDRGYGRGAAVAFSPDGKLLAAGGGNGEIRFWDAETGRERGRSLAGTPGWLLSLDFYRDGRRLVSAGSDGATRLWDVERRAPFGSSLPGFDDEHARALLVPKADRLVTVYGSRAGFVWDLAADVWKRRACSVAGRALTQREWEL